MAKNRISGVPIGYHFFKNGFIGYPKVFYGLIYIEYFVSSVETNTGVSPTSGWVNLRGVLDNANVLPYKMLFYMCILVSVG